MQSTIFSICAGACAASFSFLAATGAITTYEEAVTPPNISLAITELLYKDGHFYQTSRVTGSPAVPASWTAKIKRGNKHLCSGGDNSPYTTGTTIMTPDQWTGDQCPPLLPGDVATATWERTDNNGSTIIITRSITIGNDENEFSPERIEKDK